MEQPAVLARVDTDFYGLASNPCQNRRQVLEQYSDYLEQRYPPTCDAVRCVTGTVPNKDATQRVVCCPNCGYNATPLSTNRSNQSPQCATNAKLSAKTLGRMLKPTMGLFHGVKKGGRSWTRHLQALGKDAQFIHCGPALVLRLAMARMSDELLDLKF